ncbi:hypothetical protein [Kocuria massiliensis]|uniref:hypothetical protein n=1 Tax=Kocuria massiliensis TaxID=1926282 RepID=UPI0022B95393|nr:hypothetical protein [Kocuria massiliensis]
MTSERFPQQDPQSGTVVTPDHPDGLLEVLARSIDAVPGVTRREPSVGDFLRTLWTRPRSAQAEAADTDGLRVVVEDSTATLTAALWVSGDVPDTALSIAWAVTTRVNQVIAAHGLTPGRHNISVREVERSGQQAER